MAQYKIPQDVEAEDKLIGPFSFRQFIYLGVAALAIGAGVGLWQIFPGLIIIPLPIVILFLALALPLRKDQPMETYLVAVIRYFLKPRKRLWQPEGSIGLVTIVAPKVVEVQLTKQVGGAAAAAQLGYLAQVVDTQGWASRGVVNPAISMNDTAYAEAQQAEDILDENTNVARTFETMIDRTTDEYKSTLREQFQEQIAQAPPEPAQSEEPVPQPQKRATHGHTKSQASTDGPDDQAQDSPHLDYDPYPASMHQHVLNPLDDDDDTNNNGATPQQTKPATRSSFDQAQRTAQARPNSSDNNRAENTSLESVSPDIMRLANNNDLSISAIANEAHRLAIKENEEVVINLH